MRFGTTLRTSFLASLLAGCFPALDTAGAFIRCGGEEDCPDGLVCDVVDGLCVETRVERDAPVITEVSIDPETPRGPGEVAVVRFETSEPVLLPRVFYEVVVGGDLALKDLAVVAEAGGDDSAFVATLEVTADDVSGAYDLQADLEDLVGNRATVRLRQTVVFDLTPPTLVSASLSIASSSVDNPLFPANPQAVRTGSAARLTLVFDEALAGNATAQLQQGARVLDSSDLDGGEVVAFDFDAAALAAAAFDDGACDIHVVGSDARGNVVDVVVGDALVGGFVVDNTPPAPPVFSRLVRAPWQSQQTENASEAFAVADDAVLVLVLTAGIDVVDGAVPVNIARLEPDPATGELHARLPVDVDGLQLVAVDAAGNMSAAAPAARTEVVATILAATSPHRMSERPALRGALLQRGDRPMDDALRAGPVTTTAQPFWRPLTSVRQEAFPSPPLLSWDPMRDSFLLLSAGETFHLDGAQVIKDNAPPLPILSGGALALDVARGRIVLFGGKVADLSASNELWEWDGQFWRQVLRRDPMATDRPAPRLGHAMVHVPELGGVVVVGGCSGAGISIEFCEGNYPDETWLWDGAAFSLLCRGDACGDAPPPVSPGLAVDDEGRLVALGGSESFPGVIKLGAAAVFAFDGSRWSAECTDTCSLTRPRMPATNRETPTFASRPGGGGAVVFGSCEGVACLGRYSRDTFTLTVLDVDADGAPPDQAVAFQQAALAMDPDGTLNFAVGGNAPAIFRFVGDRLDRVAPSTTGDRCGGAAFAVDDDTIALEGGCSECRVSGFDVGDVSCTPGDGQRRIVGPAGVRDERTANVNAGFGVSLGVAGGANDEVVIIGGVNGGGQQTIGTVRNNVRSPVTLVPGLSPLLALRDPAIPGRALLAWSTSSVPAARVDRIDAIDAAGVLTPVCNSNCGALNIEGVAAAAGDNFAVVFGGSSSNRTVDNNTAVFEDGVFVARSPAQRPPPRRFGALAHDPQRDVAWLFGGTAGHRARLSKGEVGCGGGAASPDECSDVWAFDGDEWTQVVPFDPDAVQAPAGRVLAATVGVAGGLIVAGGGPTDAWRLEADSRLVPAHLMQVSLAGMGEDAASGDLTALDVFFCGVGRDAVGVVVDVGFFVWAGDRFVALDANDDADHVGCRLGHLDVSAAIAAGLERGEREITVVAAPTVTATSTGAGFASLDDSAFEVRATFARTP